ncbi:MAG: FAD-dependent oxidoreductase [Clostridia bacterium]|nr:FAD-dependent oxidoreductase [Clostridia bacterium]MDY5264064.1 FAD-dependent oxidoreductase [Eubacteriales bacterium]
MKVIIVGGVAGGASAAARLRRLDETAEITMYERSGYISYANCGLPYYVGGVITNQSDLTLQTPQSFYNRFRVNVKVLHEVIDINVNDKTITVKNLASGEIFTDSYDKLVLSTGAKALKPNLKGVDEEGVFTLRTVEDTLKIHNYVKEKNVKTAVVVGGGFIGLETAENLARLGISVTIVEAVSQVMGVLDEDMVSQVHALIKANGIKLALGSKIVSLENKKCLLDNESVIDADVILLAMGVVPDTSLINGKLDTGIKGSIIVNEKMETSVKDVYAVGDAVEVKHFITGKPSLISLAGPANKQGRIVADNIAGLNSKYDGSMGTSVLKLFDMTIASTGINEKTAKALGYDYDKVILSPASHAGYYPGGKVMTMKVLFDKSENKLLGAQIVGFDGVDKRIDVIATAIKANLKATDLAELELAYAPPYSSAKDPVNMAGFIIENVITGKVKQFYFDDVAKLQKDDDAFLLDTRTPMEYSLGHADGFTNIPVDELRERIGELPKNKTIYVMCQSGLRSYVATRILQGYGFKAYNFAGGYRFYSMVANEKLTARNTFSCGMDKK